MSVPRPPIVWWGASPANAYPNRRGYLVESIVLHTMAGTLAGCDSWFSNPAAQAGAHFGVGREQADGTVPIHQYFSIDYETPSEPNPVNSPYANGAVEPGHWAECVAENPGVNPNYITISVEHDDLGKSGTPAGLPTDMMLEYS